MPETPQPPIDDPLYPALRERVRAGSCVAIIGAGMSMEDYGSWDSLCETLVKRCDVSEEEIASTDNPQKAERAKLKNEAAYFEVLREHFKPQTSYKSYAKYQSLHRIRFHRIVTTNYDQILSETCFTNVHRVCPPDIMIRLLYNNAEDDRTPLFHLHGLMNREGDERGLVLTKSDFDRAYRPEGDLSCFLREVFRRFDVCLIGCSVPDPAWRKIAAEVSTVRRQVESEAGIPSRWFWLADDTKNNKDQIDIARAEGFLPVVLPIAQRGYAIFSEVLNDLAGRRPPTSNQLQYNIAGGPTR
jgi:hypothetical protein